MILIGSKAIKYWFPDFKREPKDTDYIVQHSEQIEKIQGVELLRNPVFETYGSPIMLPDDLYTLKMSHMFWNINWDKHMFDIQFLREKGCKLDNELFNRLYQYWNIYHEKTNALT